MHPVFHRIAGGHHEHWGPAVRAAQTAAHLEAVKLRVTRVQDHVEDDGVKFVLGGHPDRVSTRTHHIDGVTVLPQTLCQQRRHLDRVLDHQDPHHHHPGRVRAAYPHPPTPGLPGWTPMAGLPRSEPVSPGRRRRS